MDIFTRGIDVDLSPLPEQKEGEPSRDRPAIAKKSRLGFRQFPAIRKEATLPKNFLGRTQSIYNTWVEFSSERNTLAPKIGKYSVPAIKKYYDT